MNNADILQKNNNNINNTATNYSLGQSLSRREWAVNLGKNDSSAVEHGDSSRSTVKPICGNLS
jgi:hypothetical protein